MKKNDKCLQQHFKTKHLNEKNINLKTIQNIKTTKGMSIKINLTWH